MKLDSEPCSASRRPRSKPPTATVVLNRKTHMLLGRPCLAEARSPLHNLQEIHRDKMHNMHPGNGALTESVRRHLVADVVIGQRPWEVAGLRALAGGNASERRQGIGHKAQGQSGPCCNYTSHAKPRKVFKPLPRRWCSHNGGIRNLNLSALPRMQLKRKCSAVCNPFYSAQFSPRTSQPRLRTVRKRQSLKVASTWHLIWLNENWDVEAQFLSNQNWNNENLCSEAIPSG